MLFQICMDFFFCEILCEEFPGQSFQYNESKWALGHQAPNDKKNHKTIIKVVHIIHMLYSNSSKLKSVKKQTEIHIFA